LTPETAPGHRALRWGLALHLGLAAWLVAPLLPERVLVTQDLSNQVRHVFEAAAALREGQFPPLVAPFLNERRLRLFQLYSGTAYILPGSLALAVDAYTALRLTLFGLSAGAGLALARTLRRHLGCDAWAAALGAAAFQLASFPTLDLLNRGSLTEWSALQLAALTLSAALALLESRGRAAGLFLATTSALAAFIGCHPLQTLLLGAALALIVGARTVDLRRGGGRPRLGRVLLAAVCAGGLTAWFWLPIVRHWDAQQMTTWRGAQAWASAYTSLEMVFWPWARAAPQIPGWSPQYGAPLVLGLAGLTWLVLRRRVTGLLPIAVVVAAWTLLLLTPTPPWLNRHHPDWVLALGLRRLQYSYRLLIPASLFGALAVGWFSGRAWADVRPRVRALAGALALAALWAHSWPYVWRAKLTPDGAPRYELSVAELTGPGFRAPDSSFYGLVGSDYARLDWIRGGHLALGQDCALPRAGLPFDVRLVLARGAPPLRVEVEGEAVRVARRELRDRALVEFRVTPRRRFVIRFTSAGPQPASRLRFRPLGDRDWLDLPERIERLDAPGPAWRARVEAAQAGVHQLPVAHFPTDRVTVNGAPAAQASVDRYLVVATLPAGESVVQVTTRGDPQANGLSLLALALTALAAWRLRAA
jgi:hypothetical protein